MDNLVLFRLSDDDGIYVADLEAGTVERRDDADVAIARDGEPSFKGLDFALAARVRPQAAGHLLFPSR